MSQNVNNPQPDSRNSHIVKYKEERRKQLLVDQFGSSTSSEGCIRSTRTSRLRAAQAAAQSSPKVEKVSESPRFERDKSSKRKSNLNRSLTSEVVPVVDPKLIRKKRRFFPQEVLDQSSKPTTTSSESHKYKPYAARAQTTTPTTSQRKSLSTSDNELIARRMEELTAFTRETLARVERLANRTRELPTKKEKTPVSILKRKVTSKTDDETKKKTDHTHTPPVTFSPNVLEPTSTNRKQGILKKRRSLDESSVLRHRSCSPDVKCDSRSASILKQQRRSSLEDLRAQSSEIQGILKRKSSKSEEEDGSFSSPHGILKRRSGASSAGSTGHSSHVSIATAVILAAAGGAEMILEPEADSVRPILKKKSFSEEHPESDSLDGPKPILKKKSSTDTDEGGDDTTKPMRPILKHPNRESLDTGQDQLLRHFRFSDANGDSDRTILKFRPDSPRPCRLTFTAEGRRYNTICSDFNVQSNAITRDRDDDRDLKKARPLSVSELVRSFERQVDETTGAVPKRINQKRDRYRTQPVTSDELLESRNFLRQEELYKFASLDIPADDKLCGFLNSTAVSPPDSPACHKTSSDSAFQSLGDGLEEPPQPDSTDDTMSSLADQMKNLAEEARKKRLEKRGILKPNQNEPKRSQSFVSTAPRPSTCVRSVDDEGISCNDSGSDSEAKINDSTSEGESSGAREVKSIFRNEKLNFKQQLEGCLSKSNSAFLPVKPCNNNTTETSPSTLRRSHTHTAGAMPQSIADLRAKLQESGEKGWKKRVPLNNNSCDELKLLKEKNRYNDELIDRSSLLASKKDELDAASKQWKVRVEKSDAEKFSVAGKMAEKIRDGSIKVDVEKKTPQAKRYRGKDDSSSTPSSPEKVNQFDLIRSQSALSPIASMQDVKVVKSKTVTIFKPDDITFTKFFNKSRSHDRVEVTTEDFDAIPQHSLLTFKKNVPMGRRKVAASRNPIKALSNRTDISSEYTETITGVAEREKKRLNIEKLAKTSDKALETLAGLASSEDFKSVNLKKGGTAPTTTTTLLPWKGLMLLQVKGRRTVQVRLVEPVETSINEGDCYILVTSKTLFNYTGTYSNVIEQSRAADLANHIQKSSDLGCKVTKVINVSWKEPKDFWKVLGCSATEMIEAGHPNEDETYETNILHTNMIYQIDDNELVPYEPYWGTIPKVEMLHESNVIVFDFGTEMYVWSGKNAPLDKKRAALKLAKQLWSDGYNYSDCNVNPVNVAQTLGEREVKELPTKADSRPTWALFAKITQHRETILFREKFADWPDFTRVIQMKEGSGLKRGNGSIEIKPCNLDVETKSSINPDLVVQNVHLGRGDTYFDEDTRRLFQYDTEEIKGWRILENTHEELETIGQFYDGDCYIYSWRFRQTVKGRELNGKPSKHCQVGRDMTIFFCWHGSKSSVTEKCTAAFLTVQLDKENAPQVRVVQGAEPAAFLRLFNGSMCIRHGKLGDSSKDVQLFIVRGELEDEAYLMEVKPESGSLRSRTSYVLMGNQVYIWHGSKSTQQKMKTAKSVAAKLTKEDFVELMEGEENEEFFKILGKDRNYHSLLNDESSFDYTPRLFKFSSLTGRFIAQEVVCPHRSDHTTPYPFVQHELYNSSQPTLYLFDNQSELWLWQGWWPVDSGDEDSTELNPDQTGSGAIRWQKERRAAMESAVSYWEKLHPDKKEIKAYLVWAGLEPLAFRCLFPNWEIRDDARQLNLQDGRLDGDKQSLETELSLLSRTTFPLAQIMQRPLPIGVDPTQLEIYLSDTDFETLLEMSKEEFESLPSWRKTSLKKEKGLF